MAPTEKGKGAGAGAGGAGVSKFRNDARMAALLAAFRKGDRAEMEAIVDSRQENAKLHKKLKGKDASWEELKEDTVYKVEIAGGETVVAKFFPQEEGFPFHEICGNVVGTSLLGPGGGGPFFVRALDVGRSTDDGQWVVVMEYLEHDAEAIDLDEPSNLYNLLYQVAYGVEQLRRAANLQHFDLRYDNIMLKLLPEPRDLFKNGILAPFVVKIGDWGQCEFDFPPQAGAGKGGTGGSSSSSGTEAAAAAAASTEAGGGKAEQEQSAPKRVKLSQEEEDTASKTPTTTTTTKPDNKENEAGAAAEAAEAPTTVVTTRPENGSIPREEEYRRKWGVYPREYTGYDFQYFLGTLTPVLDSLHGLPYYHVYTMALDFLKPCAFTQAQDRPTEVTARTPVEVLRYLKEEVSPTL